MNTSQNTIAREDLEELKWEKIKFTPNKEFMQILFSIAEKYQIFTEKDLQLLTSTKQCKRAFKRMGRAILMDVTGFTKKEIDEAVKVTANEGEVGNQQRHYKSPIYKFNLREYVVYSEMYGVYKNGVPGRGDNRTFLYNWFMKRLEELHMIPEEENIMWIPTLEEYNPEISKEKWIKLLHDKSIASEKSLNVLDAFYRNGGQGTCIELEEKYGKTADYYRMVAVNLADRIINLTGCPKPTVDGETKLWPVLFIGRKTEKEERGDFIWKLRPELYDALSEFTYDTFEEDGGETELSNKEIIEQVKQYIAAKGFAYNDGLIENFYLSLKSKPFVILAGTSGTGKTRLVRLFAEAVGANTVNGRYKLASVRPDWSDSSDLFGHVDLNGNFVAGAITEFVESAIEDKTNPYFLCLDEMNLARVEYYLSDILSIMETRDYNDDEIVTDDIPLEGHTALTIPENLYIIGTVNMDETTFPFSKKVLDRANTIEFSYVDLLPDFNSIPQPVDVVKGVKNSFLKTEYLYLLNCTDKEKAKAEDICTVLQQINEILRTANAHIGYRVRDEIVFYILNNISTNLLLEEEAMDNEILQKILPRIQGSSVAIRDMICELFKFCAGDYAGYRSDSGEISKKMIKALEEKNALYPKSAEKLAYMMRRYEEDGFTSYWL